MITLPLGGPATPFYTGDVAATPSEPESVSLAGVEYPIDLRSYRHRGLPSFRDGIVTSGETGDQLFDSQGAWWRYRFSWELGAGQLVADLDREDTSPQRFYRSRGIDPWTQYQACLLPATAKKLTTSVTGVRMIATATHLYVADGGAVKRTPNLSGTPTWLTIGGAFSGTAVDLTTDGTDCYIATVNDIFRVTVGSTAATAVTTATPANGYTSIAFVANRLLAGDGDQLVQIEPTSLETIYDHYQPAFRWTTMFQVGSRIYVGGYSGNRSELFTTTTTDDGSLAIAAEAASFFAGELIQTALSYGGSVILGTSKGIRFATLGSDGSLQYGPLIEAGGSCRCIAAEGRFAWFGWDAFPDGGAGVGRLALDTFVDALQPAYATDVWSEASDDDVVACARFGGRTVFAVANDGVYATQPGTFVTDGYIDTGEITFGTVEAKSVTETTLRSTPLDVGEGLTLTVYDAETGNTLGTSHVDELGAVAITVQANGEIVNRITTRLGLSSDGTSSACLRFWRSRAYPIGPPMQEWIVPLVIQSAVVVGQGQGRIQAFDVFAEVARIKRFWQSREVINFSIGNHTHRVRIDNFEHEGFKWRDDSDWLEGTLTLRLLSV